MIVNLITFSSFLHDRDSIKTSHEAILTRLEKYFTLNFVDSSEVAKLTPDDFCILFVATGGVERLLIQYFEALTKPVIMMADGMQNSLAAALEMSAWMRVRGLKSEILHGELSEIVKRIFVLYNNFKAQRKLYGARIGVIGVPSNWLIASNVDYLLAKRRWGIDYIEVPIEHLCDYYRQISDDEIGEICARLALHALACHDASPEDMLKAMRVYKALQRIVLEEQFNALTLNCFKLLELIGCTGCLALSKLNDDGIVAGCEGDLQSVFTMLAIKILSGQETFMGNPSMINTRSNEIILSHCTIGLKQTEQFMLCSHFESGKSIGIRGILPVGDVTIAKCGGECLDQYYLATGTLTENTDYRNMCRTQIRVHLNSPVSYFLRNPLGNHHVLLQGNYETLLNDFFQVNACLRIE